MPFSLIKPVLQAKLIRSLCTKPYYNHPKGCPNFNKKTTCPPKVKHFDQVYDMNNKIYAIWNEFDFKAHVNKMRNKHPNWTQKQVECCLYWQSNARKQLKIECKKFARSHNGYSLCSCPEGMGVNLTETMKQIGIELEWPPKNKTFQIALAASELVP